MRVSLIPALVVAGQALVGTSLVPASQAGPAGIFQTRLRQLFPAAASSSASFSLGAAQDAHRSIWDGVYTEAQALRGQQAYKEHCGYCHRDNLSGGGSEAGAPALVGPIFTYRWADQPIADLFVTIGTTMPQNKPDTLDPQTVVDIVSFVLQSNDVPAGPAELPPDVAALKTIAMAAKRP